MQALDVAAKYDLGRKIADDSNDLSTCDTYSVSQSIVHSHSGILDTYICYYSDGRSEFSLLAISYEPR